MPGRKLRLRLSAWVFLSMAATGVVSAAAVQGEGKKMEPVIRIGLDAPFPDAQAGFLEAMEIVKRRSYNADLSDEIIYFTALQAVLRRLAPESDKDMLQLWPPEVDAPAKAKLEGEMVSIGVSLDIRKNLLIVTDVVPGGPAHRQGIGLGDRIAAIDGDFLGGRGLREAEAMLYKPAGTVIELEIERAGKRFKVRVTCEKFRAKDVRSETLRGVGVMRVLRFSKVVVDDFMEQVAQLREQKVRGIVLDLRGSAGGLVWVGEMLACHFLADGATAFHVVSRDLIMKAIRCDKGGDVETPLVVIVNKGTVSTGEILTAALKENGRAKVVGAATKGYGAMKEKARLKNGYTFKYLTDILYGPNRRTWLGRGLAPDKAVALSEADLDAARMEPDEEKRLEMDTQLAAAIGLIAP